MTEHPPAPARQVLLVAIDEGLRAALEASLRAEGYAVVAAPGTRQAIAAIAATGFDLVIADIAPSGDGSIELLERVRARDPDCPVVVIAGGPASEARAQARRLGAFDALVKPVTGRAVLDAARRALKHRSPPPGQPSETPVRGLAAQVRVSMEELRVLAAIGRIVASSVDVSEVYPRFAEQARKLTPFDRIVVTTIEDGVVRDAYVAGVEIPGLPAGGSYPLRDSPSYEVVQRRSSIVAGEQELAELEARYPAFKGGRAAGLRSLLRVPLIWQDSVVGVLSFRSRLPAPYGDREVALAEQIAAQIAGSIATARLYEATRRQSEERAALAAVGRIISSSLIINEVIDRCAERVRDLLPLDRMTIGVVDRARNVIQRLYTTGLEVPGWEQGASYPVTGTLHQRAVESGRPVAANLETMDETEAGGGPRPGWSAGLRSVLAVPLLSRGETIGLLHLSSRIPNAYAEHHLALAEQLGAQIAGALANAQLHEQMRREAKESAILAEIGRIIGSSLDINEVYERFATQVRELIAFDRILVTTIDQERGVWVHSYVSGREIPGLAAGEHRPLRGSVTGYVAGQRKSLLATVDGLPDELTEWGETLRRVGLQAVIAVPLFHKDEVIGVLHLRSAQADAYSERELALAERIAGEIAGAVANAQLHAETERARQALRASEARYRDLVETSQDLIWMCDEEGRFTYLNPAWEQTHGYRVEEMLGRPFTDFQRPEVAGRDMAVFRRLVAGDSVKNYETTHVSRTGDDIHLLFNAMPRRDASGTIVGAHGTAYDITERVRAEATLRVQSVALESATDAVLVADSSGTITVANPAAERMFGFSQRGMIGRPITDLMPEEYRELHEAGLARVASGRPTRVIGRTVELEGLRRDGARFPIELSLARVAGGDSDSFVAVLRDVTERNRAAEALRVRSAAIEAAADMVVITDESGVIEYVNEAFTRGTGYARDEAVGNTPRILKSGRQDTAFYRELWETILSGRVWSGTLVNRRKDGTEYPEEMTITPVPARDGAQGCFIAIKRNVTDRIRAEKERRLRLQLDAENRELQRVNEARSQFLSTVSHELKTPLTSVIAFTDILARNRGGNLQPVQMRQLRVIRRNGERLRALIDDLLDVSRVDLGRLELEMRVFDAADLLRDLAQSFRPITEKKNQRLNVRIPGGIVPIRADHTRLEQVINNLLANASKYSPPGTTVEFTAIAQDDRLNVVVRDHGIGISEEDQKRLFTPFFRVDNAQTRAEPGSGLGLVIVKSIVELHHGALKLHSQPGKGTTVSFHIPGVLPADTPLTEEKPARPHAAWGDP